MRRFSASMKFSMELYKFRDEFLTAHQRFPYEAQQMHGTLAVFSSLLKVLFAGQEQSFFGARAMGTCKSSIHMALMSDFYKISWKMLYKNSLAVFKSTKILD